MKLGKGFKKTCAMALSASMIISAFSGAAFAKTVNASSTGYKFDYNTALVDSITFYDAQKCGKDVGENNAFDWRDACHVNDGSDVGLDLSGGYHDCGDHVKFGITQGYAASILEWGYYNYADAYKKAGAETKTLETLKHFTDYFLKCHPNMFTFYYQCGNGDIDHSYWGAPEKQEAAQGKRQTMYKADASNAASDVCGEAAAALALMSINYKSIDASYAAKCLAAAKSIYTLGTGNLGCGKGQSYYTETSYNDDLAWAAICLYKATGTSSYLSAAKNFIKDGKSKPMETTWALCWNDAWLAAEVELYKETKDPAYLAALKTNMDYWINDLKTTNGGMKYLTQWGNLRYVAAQCLVAMQYYGITGDTKAKDLAVSQINYILGDNPANESYMIGFGSKYPQHPHQRAANGYDNSGMNNPAKHVLLGGLVGGPSESDYFSDNVNDWFTTEGGIDYNAGLVGAIAAIVAQGQESHPSTSEAPATTTVPSVAPSSEAPATTTVPSVAPSSEAPATTTAPSVAPVTSSTPSGSTDVNGVIPSVKVSTQSGSSISQNYTISSVGTKDVELSKLTIRYYYSKDGSKDQNFWCDNAGLQINVAPYYVNLASNVNAVFHDGYVEITFDSTQKLAANSGSLNMGVRFANADWSSYTNFVDKGCKVFYNGVEIAQ